MPSKKENPPDELKTVELKDVEILATGTWSGSKEVTYTKKDLDAIVAAFDELTSDPQLNYEAPAKLGHDEKQKLLQSDGYPAAGWVSALRRKGDKLVADFKNVPGKIGSLIEAGGYKKVSSEIYENYVIGGKVYALVLKAVSFLGSDIPAVKTIKDILATYDEKGVRVVVVEYSESLDKRLRTISDAYGKATRPAEVAPIAIQNDTGWVKEVFDDFIIICKGSTYWQVPYTEQGDTIAFDFAGVVQVEQVYQPIAAAKQVGEGGNNLNERKVEMEEKVIREALGIDDKADILATISQLRASSANVATLTEKASTADKEKERADKLATTLAERDADAEVEKAITNGKIPPAEREYWQGSARKDLPGFKSFMEKKSKVIVLGEKGSGSGDGGEAVTLTETEKKTAKDMGVSEADYIAQKQKDAKGGKS